MTPFIPISPYIKKEDAREAVTSQRRLLVIVLAALALVIFIMQMLVVPKMTGLYQITGAEMPLATRYSPQIGWALIGLAFTGIVYILTSPPNYSKIDEIASKYKDGEMIKTSELIHLNPEPLLLVVLGVYVGLIVFSIIMPIYKITGAL
jgi:type II secretory pathway component PulF